MAADRTGGAKSSGFRIGPHWRDGIDAYLRDLQKLSYMNPPEAPGTGQTREQLAAQARANAALAVQHKAWNVFGGGPFWFHDQVNTDGPWDYKNNGNKAYEDFGNYKYGYTGAAAGFPAGILLRQAGLQQILRRNSLPEFGNPGNGLFGGSGSFGDDPKDQEMIIRGASDWRNGNGR